MLESDVHKLSSVHMCQSTEVLLIKKDPTKTLFCQKILNWENSLQKHAIIFYINL